MAEPLYPAFRRHQFVGDPSFLAAQSDDPRHPFTLPVVHASPVHVTALFYNKALLDKADLQPPRTLADMKAMVQPLKALGAVPLVHPSGEVSWNPLLVTWIQPMPVNNQLMEFTQKTLNNEVKYNGPEWIKTFEVIANLTRDGVLGPGSGALGVDAAYQLFKQGRAAMLYTGSWSLPALTRGISAGGGVDLHVTGLPLVENAPKAQPIIAFNAYAIAAASKNKEAAVRWLTYTARRWSREKCSQKQRATRCRRRRTSCVERVAVTSSSTRPRNLVWVLPV